MKQLAKILDVGCGGQCLPGAVGIDVFPHPGVEFVHDLNQAPWPLPDHHFSSVRCQHVIEHIAQLQIFAAELYRVCADQTVIDFITPHYSSYASWGDPTHLFHFALGSIPQLFEQVVGKDHFEVVSNEIRFTGAVIELPGWLIYKISPKKYEKHFAWMFPANEIHTKIRILKKPALNPAP